MTQAERDRLVALKKAKKKLITQKQAAEEIGVTERQVRRLLRKLRRKGDQAVIHELRGRPSNRRLPAEVERQALAVLSDPLYRGFGPTLAAEYLHKLHQITVSKETLRRWMAKAGLWRSGHPRVVEVHQWRPRRSRCGELVQWDTSTHDWLEGRGGQIYLISMIDDATAQVGWLRARPRLESGAGTEKARHATHRLRCRRTQGRPRSGFSNRAARAGLSRSAGRFRGCSTRASGFANPHTIPSRRRGHRN